ncbi:MAG: DUF1223 domain-containing protein, partial [Acidobacteriota bacterium]
MLRGVAGVVVLAALAALVPLTGRQLRAAPPPSPPVPVVVELFTSEGCSSCPPADGVLTTLVATQPVAGARIIALGEHVDYWDRLGWRDPFSSAQFSSRQTQYAASLPHSGGVYTPQLVIDGGQELVGSNLRAATAAVALAAARSAPRFRVSLAVAPRTAAALQVTIAVLPPGEGAGRTAPDVWLAVTEDGLESHVQRGENHGRTLRHTAVVRSLVRLGAPAAGHAAWTATRSVS